MLPKIGSGRTQFAFGVLAAIIAIVAVGAYFKNLAVISTTVPLLTSVLLILAGGKDKDGAETE